MGRHRKYHTPEEKLGANRKARRRYYHKNKEAINRERRAAYKEAHPNRMETQLEALREADRRRAEEASAPAFWVRRCSKIPNQLAEILGDKPRRHFDSICAAHLQADNVVGSESKLEAQLAKVVLWEKITSKCLDEILQLAGCSSDYAKVASIANELKDVRHALEEIICYIDISVDELREVHQRGEMYYQTTWVD